MDEKDALKLIKRYEKLNADKSQWHSHWDDLARVMLPRRLGFSSTTIEGERRSDSTFDGTPMQAARGLANAIGGILRPQGLPEVEIKAEEDAINEMEEALIWLANAEKLLRAAFNNPKSRFRTSSSEKDLDLVVFGTAIMFIGESQQRNHLLFQSVHLKDGVPYFNEDGAPEGMFRKLRMPYHQLVQRFGEEKLSKETREKGEKDPDAKIDILHVVVPRESTKSKPLFAKDLPIADYWIEMDKKHLISESGFHEFPFIVPRWDTSSGEDFGRSPGMIALPDSDTLQAMGETILIAGQRAADPPLAVPNDGSFSAVNTFPGGLVYYDLETATAMRGNPFFPLVSGSNLPISRDMQADVRDQVWAAFYRNILRLPVTGPEMTATEIMQRKDEFLREIGPAFGRFEVDDTAPTVERAFMIKLRAGGFGPIPPILQGQNIRFEYDSPVIRVRKQIEAAAARLWAQERIEIAASTNRPEILDVVNFDELSRFSSDALGIPKDIVNSEEVVENIRKARQEAMEARQREEAQIKSMMAANAAADIAKKGAEAEQVVKQTEVI